ncbi:deoxyribonuclease gamma-like isoform X2 [Megalops cyprinoides]|uniref:deoxyribonuclease gamma-like isoform X2 n=1 Tax=Megalops cyprinoides TaxID=118141 RepID=UPI0018650536|nr:deoxyribonuclease gamma-like isoform X2 [Megalops cyprinoides]
MLGSSTMHHGYPLLILFLLCLRGLDLVLGFKICAFNIQSFGDSKSTNVPVMHTLVRILSRCDVCLLQEVRDFKGKAIPTLLSVLNRYDEKYHYDYVASGRLGRTSYQEQYVFVYRTGSVMLQDTYQYPDTQKGDMDAFSREPFVVRFKAPKTVIGDFVLIPQHTTPSNATKEIDELYDVFLDVKKKWKIEDVMFLGDLNAACGYVAKKNRKNIRLMSMPEFYWLIKDQDDTTVRETTSCAYDRIVVHGETFLRAIEPYSARPFRFDKEFHLPLEKALDVSDHYPVEVELKTWSSAWRQAQVHPLLVPLAVLILGSSLLSGSDLE